MGIMPRKKKADPSLDEMPEMPEMADGPIEDIPEIAPRTKTSSLRAVPKEFDLRAAHNAWKERHGIDTDDTW